MAIFARRPGFEELFFAVDQRVDVVGGELDAVSVSDGVGGAGFDAVAAEDAARIVDVVDLGVAFAGGDRLRFGIFRGLDVDTVRGASGGAQESSRRTFRIRFRRAAGRECRDSAAGRWRERPESFPWWSCRTWSAT